jgi:hypothetical protein
MLFFVRCWILLSTVLCGAGWILSAFYALNPAGYGVIFLLAGIAAVRWQWKIRWPSGEKIRRVCHKLRHRFRQPAPLLFLSLIFLALLSGALFPPVPGDASMYRTPRVLHWLAQGHWHWIRTFDTRLNTRGCGFEWLTAPLLLFTKTDRLFFLINLISYALLPGLIFSVFRRLRVRGQTAWWWMWLLPAGWCYALQAGTLANDGFAAIYALAAVDFALRAGEGRRVSDLWLSVLAMCLLTGVKQTMIPLALLWLIAAAPNFRLLLARPLATAVIIAMGLLVSALPMMCLNLLHDANWAGIPKHPDPMDPWRKLVELNSPYWGVIGNVFYLLAQNFATPFLPFYEKWNGGMQRFIQTPLGMHFASFESFGKLPSFLTEQTAGLGLMVCLFLLVSIFWTWRWRSRKSVVVSAPVANFQIHLLRLVPWCLLLLFMAKIGTIETARLLSPYYPYLLPVMLAQKGHQQLVRQRCWQRFGLLAMLSAAAILILSPARPLWPAFTVLADLQQCHPESKVISRLRSFYSTSEIDLVERRPFQEELPAAEHLIGYATDIRGLEPGLWRPFTRQVERVLPDDSRQFLQQRGIHYVVVDEPFLTLSSCTIGQLMQNYDAQLIDQLALSRGWHQAPEYVYLIRLNSDRSAH